MKGWSLENYCRCMIRFRSTTIVVDKIIEETDDQIIFFVATHVINHEALHMTTADSRFGCNTRVIPLLQKSNVFTDNVLIHTMMDIKHVPLDRQ